MTSTRLPQNNPRRANFKHAFATKMRQEMTDAEAKLWRLVRGKQFAGLRFRRQHPVGAYVADFFCAAAKVIIECDGEQHGRERDLAYDDARTEWLNDEGYRVLRFGNHDVLRAADTVLEAIWHAIVDSGIPLPDRENIPSPKFASQISTLPQGEGRSCTKAEPSSERSRQFWLTRQRARRW